MYHPCPTRRQTVTVSLSRCSLTTQNSVSLSPVGPGPLTVLSGVGPRPPVTAWAGPAIVRWAVREERGQIYCAPEVLQRTNRYNENDGVSKRVHELAFGIVICFGSEGSPVNFKVMVWPRVRTGTRTKAGS